MQSTPSIQYNAASPDKEVLDGNMRFLAVFGMEHPSVINGTVYNASYYGTRECGIKIKTAKAFTRRIVTRKSTKLANCAEIWALKKIQTEWRHDTPLPFDFN